MEIDAARIANSHQHEPDAKSCRTCSKEKPYPEDFITSYLKMVIGSECRECRKERKIRYNKKCLGPTQKALRWRNTISKYHPSSPKPKKFRDD